MSQPQFKIELSGDARKLMERVSVPLGAMHAAAKAIKEENDVTVSAIQSKYLSFPKSGPSVAVGLRHQTGRARQAVRANEPVVSAQVVTSSIGGFVKSKGGGVNYLAVHEYGATIPPHEISAPPGKTLRFQIGGRVLFRRKVKHPGATLPARGMIQRGIRERLPEYGASCSAAVIEFYGGAK